MSEGLSSSVSARPREAPITATRRAAIRAVALAAVLAILPGTGGAAALDPTQWQRTDSGALPFGAVGGHL